MGRPDLISAEAIIQGYRQLIVRAHANGVRVIGATMTPFAGSPAYTEDKEKVREAVNEWIRTSNAFDAVIDFDAVVRDQQDPKKLKAEYASVDHIHLNDAGYKAMAAAINLSTLQSKAPRGGKHHTMKPRTIRARRIVTYAFSFGLIGSGIAANAAAISSWRCRRSCYCEFIRKRRPIVRGVIPAPAVGAPKIIVGPRSSVKLSPVSAIS